MVWQFSLMFRHNITGITKSTIKLSIIKEKDIIRTVILRITAVSIMMVTGWTKCIRLLLETLAEVMHATVTGCFTKDVL